MCGYMCTHFCCFRHLPPGNTVSLLLFFKLMDVSLSYGCLDVACSRCCWYPTQISTLLGQCLHLPAAAGIGYNDSHLYPSPEACPWLTVIASTKYIGEIVKIMPHHPLCSLGMTHSQWLFRSETAQPPCLLDWLTSAVQSTLLECLTGSSWG